MTKVRLSLVALGLEHMVVFVFALPPPPARLHNRRDVLSRDAVIEAEKFTHHTLEELMG